MGLSIKELKQNLSTAKKGLHEASNVGSRFWKNYWQNEINKLEQLIEEEKNKKEKPVEEETACAGQISFDDTETAKSIIE